MTEASRIAPRVWLYASFAATPVGGNPAGVVVSAEPLAAERAQMTATALGAPTTGFVVADEAAAAGTADVRFFTPSQEIGACGHVTVAIAHALIECGIWQWGGHGTVQAQGGTFPLRLRDGFVEMDQRLQVMEPAAIEWRDVNGALGPLRHDARLPLAVAGTGLRHLIVPARDVPALGELALDAGRVAALAARANVDTICVWASAGRQRFRVRDLCAGIGVLEEPASGTTSAALAFYLARQRRLDGEEFVVEQGVEMQRPSEIGVVVKGPELVAIRGGARKILAGELQVV
jgi:PhzF family phenazine biosynthesis protein